MFLIRVSQCGSQEKNLIFKCCLIHLKALCKALHNAFKALKTSGFNIEDTHLTDIDPNKQTPCPGHFCFYLGVYSGGFSGLHPSN